MACEPPLVHITLQSVSGRLLKLQLGPDADLAALKNAVADAWKIPTLFQKMLVGPELLNDDFLVGQLWERGLVAPVVLTVIIDGVVEGSTSECKRTRLLAVETLAHMGQQSGATHLPALCGCSNDEDVAVRRAVVDALARFLDRSQNADEAAQEVQELIVETLAARADDENSLVQRAALEALAGAAILDQKRIKDLMVLHSQSRESLARRVAVGALAGTLKREDSLVVGILISHVWDSDALVRRVVVSALAKVVQANDTNIVEALLSRSSDETQIARLALTGLARIAKPDDDHIIKVLLDCVTHEDCTIKRTAIEALGRVAQRFYCDDVFITCSGDEDVIVRLAATKALKRLVQAGDTLIIEALEARLHDNDEIVRRIAEQGLAQAV